jgi:Flp pilus assembly protein TadB
MLFTFTLMMSALVFATRITSSVVTRHLLTTEQMTKIGTIYVLTLACGVVFARESRVLLWVFAFFPQAFFLAAVFILHVSRTCAFRARFIEALSLVILKMKSGKSFRHAFSETITESDPYLREKLAEINDLVVFSQQHALTQHTAFIRHLVCELRLADQAPHASLKRLQTFRDRLRGEDDFRRRSGQVLRQIRAQSLLMVGLYVAVMAFVIRQFGFRPHIRLISVSLLLFTLGISWIWLGGRRLKWKV